MLKGPVWSIGPQVGLSFSQKQVLHILGHSLRKLYGEVIEEDLPERLRSAVETLEARTRGSSRQ
jgi:hypothetical protein